MLGRSVRLVLRHARIVVVAAFVVSGIAAVFGSTVASLMSGDVGAANAPSAHADERIERASGRSPTGDDLLVLIRLPSRWPSAGARRDVTEDVATLRQVDGVTAVIAPRAARDALVSSGRYLAIVTASIDTTASEDDVASAARSAFSHDPDVTVGGRAVIDLEFGERIAADLARAELVAFPLLFVLAVWIFRGVIAALVPLLVGGLAIIVTLALLRGVLLFANLSEYVLNLVIGLGLGLGIDYCLFIISRYREEVAKIGYGREAALRAGLRAGRTVLFSAVTVAIAMSSLLIFPQTFLYSMGVGGVIVTLVAAASAVLLVPALLMVLGPRIDSLVPERWRLARQLESADPRSGRWFRLASWVMRRARWVFPAALLVGVLLALPALHTRFSDVDGSALPTSSAARQVDDTLAAEFPRLAGNTVYLAIDAPPATSASDPVLALSQRVVTVPGVTSTATTYLGHDTWQVSALVRGSPFSQAASNAVVDLRAIPSTLPFLVGGDAAAYVDLESSLRSLLPWALLLIAVVILFVVFLLTGSVVLSVKTLLLNAFNVAMTFGVLVWVFQYGHFQGLLHYESTGRIDLTQPILVAIIAFGLSTDYGVFLLARITEAHVEGHPDSEAVPLGVGRSGRLISSAALLLAIAVGAFSSSSVLFIKELGVGAATAVFLDATLVRAFLVPSAMRLLGAANWWAPATLRRLHRRIGIAHEPAMAGVTSGVFGQGSDRSQRPDRTDRTDRTDPTDRTDRTGRRSPAGRAPDAPPAADPPPLTRPPRAVTTPTTPLMPSRYTGLTVQVNVGNTEDARAFYSLLFGREPDSEPITEFMEWRVVSGAEVWWQVVRLPVPVRPLETRTRFQVADVRAAAAWATAELGVDVDRVTSVDEVVAFTDFEDPWGNRLGFYEELFPGGTRLALSLPAGRRGPGRLRRPHRELPS